jgi:hypothetical protein
LVWRLCGEALIRQDSDVLRTTRSLRAAVLTLIAALAIALGSSISAAPPVSASTTTEVIDTRTPAPLLPIFNPVVIGLHLIDALAEGIADVVEFVGTPAPIAIPAPHDT